MDDLTSEQALSQVLTGNYLAEQERVRAEEEAEYRESYNAWLDEQADDEAMRHDEWLEEVYAAEQLERMEGERAERINDH